MYLGRWDEWMTEGEEAVRDDTQHRDAGLGIAAMIHEAKDAEKAAGAWRKVLDVDPQNRLARRRLEEYRAQITSSREALRPKN